MDFWEITKLLFRRWMITLPLLVVFGAAGAIPLTRVGPSYVALAYVQLVPPVITEADPEKPAAEQRNPWLGLGGHALANAVIVSVSDQHVIKQLKRAGCSDQFTLTVNEQTPMITFEVTGDSRQQAIATTIQLVTRFAQTTADLQEAYQVSKQDTIKAHRLGHGVDVTTSNSTLKRATAAVSAVVLLMTVASTVALDAGLRRRRSRKTAPSENIEPAATS